MTVFAKIGDTVPAGAIVTDSNSHGVYYHMPEKKDPRDPGNWRDGDDAMGAYKEQTMADVGYPAPPDVDWLNEVRTALRDQFAMCAMQALVNNDRISDPKGMALRAYEYADAMMVAREMKR